MPKYIFEAKSLSGEKVKGSIESASPQAAQSELRSKQLILSRLTVVNDNTKDLLSLSKAFLLRKKIKTKELQLFTRQFSVLLDAGIPVVQSLEAMTGAGRNPLLNEALQSIVQDLRGGKKLSEALGKQSHIFYFLYTNLVKVGEESGNLKQVLDALSYYIEKEEKIKKKVIGAMMYPAIVGIIASLVVLAIMILVVPKYQAIFQSSKVELPEITQFIVLLSEWAKGNSLILFAIPFVGPGALYFLYSFPSVKQFLDQIIVHVPVFGDLVKKANLARFARNFATLLESGVNILRSVELSVSSITNHTLHQSFIPIKEAILRGRSLIDPLKGSKYVPNMVQQMMDIGEKTGNLGSMMVKIADFYEDEVEITIDVMTQLIEPLMILSLGIIIAFIMLAINLPIFKLTEALV